ncbi:class I SAM-dependent methyltransferase [Nocardia rhizosphaerae]|uniref:Class I SAM-dependent methyltransferase n=1 Tax=Nocardia rhizosphaerae TaxID=1691571 RepID=A0ABV8L7E8_9NOCA
MPEELTATGTEPQPATHAHGAGRPGTDGDPATFWENFYREREQIWTGNANKTLVREVTGLTPGTALDLGCGEGGDAIWLATEGWQVTAVDISATAMERGARHAADAGVRISWERHDLDESFPEGTFDLVSAQFLHSPVERPDERQAILRKAAAAVAPGGALVIGSHAHWPTWVTTPPHDVSFPTIEQMLDELDLGPEWRVETAELVTSPSTSPDGVEGERADSVLRLRRG